MTPSQFNDTNGAVLASVQEYVIQILTPYRAIFAALLITGCSPEASVPEMSESAVRGQSGFADHCALCHSLTPSPPHTAPRLSGLIGRKAGTESFPYSDALRASGLTWDENTLEAFLADPTTLIPNNQMAFYGLEDEATRQDLIAYLVYVSDHPE